MTEVALEEGRIIAGTGFNQPAHEVAGSLVVVAHPFVIFMEDRGPAYGLDPDAAEMEVR
jgi:hypothetical protein